MLVTKLSPRTVLTRALLAACLMLLLGPALPAAARSVCCDGKQPMLCKIRYRIGPLRDMKVLTESDVSLDVGENVVLEAEGWDSKKRKFPNDHVYMGYEVGNDCHGKLEVDRLNNRTFRLRAGDTVGRCTLHLWAAGNENLHEQFNIRIAASTSGSASPRPMPGDPASLDTSRPKAQLNAEAIVKRLYKAVLRREPSPDELQTAAQAVRQGNLPKLAENMVRSPEFRNSLRQRSARTLLDDFYRGLLGRPPDAGASGHLRNLEAGRTYEVLMAILRSDEFREVIQRDTAR
jgi:hypothetical protein